MGVLSALIASNQELVIEGTIEQWSFRHLHFDLEAGNGAQRSRPEEPNIAQAQVNGDRGLELPTWCRAVQATLRGLPWRRFERKWSVPSPYRVPPDLTTLARRNGGNSLTPM